jgi:hypothetical protein
MLIQFLAVQARELALAVKNNDYFNFVQHGIFLGLCG